MIAFLRQTYPRALPGGGAEVVASDAGMEPLHRLRVRSTGDAGGKGDAAVAQDRAEIDEEEAALAFGQPRGMNEAERARCIALRHRLRP